MPAGFRNAPATFLLVALSLVCSLAQYFLLVPPDALLLSPHPLSHTQPLKTSSRARGAS